LEENEVVITFNGPPGVAVCKEREIAILRAKLGEVAEEPFAVKYTIEAPHMQPKFGDLTVETPGRDL
jgi:hypothetical protein